MALGQEAVGDPAAEEGPLGGGGGVGGLGQDAVQLRQAGGEGDGAAELHPAGRRHMPLRGRGGPAVWPSGG